jgi:hypothetical protein
VIGSRIRSRRLGAILATALFTIALVPGIATAGNTRSVFIGSPDAQTNAGRLLPSAVTVPATGLVNSTLIPVQVKSIDNQTIAHTILTIDWNKSSNAGLSLNAVQFIDLTDDGIDDVAGCSAGSGTIITCNFNNLPARATRTVGVVVDVASTFVASTQVQPLFFAHVVTNNENGSNTQLFDATSGPWATTPPNTDPGFKVGAFDSDTVLTFALPNSSNNLANTAPSSTNKLQAKVAFDTVKGKIVAITEGQSTDLLYKCPTGLQQACQTTFSQVTAGDGAFPDSPYFTWTLNALVPNTYNKSQGYVVHYPTGAKDSDWILLFKNSSSLCGTDIAAKITAQGHCISALSLTKVDKSTQLLSVTVVMDHQGGLKY